MASTSLDSAAQWVYHGCGVEMGISKNPGAKFLGVRLCAASAAVLALFSISGCAKPRGSEALKEGAAALEEGSIGVAVQLLEQAREDLKGLTAHTKTLNYLGMAYREQGRLDKAEETLVACLRLDPAFHEARYNLGIVYFERENYSAAKEQLEHYTKRDPKHYLAACYLASAYLRTNDTAKAKALYESLVERIPKDAAHAELRAQVANGLGVIAAKRGETREAASYFQESLKHDPSFAEAQLNLAVLNQTKLQNKREAAEHYKQFLAARPDSPHAETARRVAEQLQRELAPPAPTPTPPPRSTVTPSAPTTQIQPPPTPAAPPDIRPPAIAPTAPPSVPPPTPMPPAQIEAPSDSFQKAVNDFNTLIKLHTEAKRFREAGAAAVNLGELWRQQGNLAEARDAFAQAVNLDPRNLTALASLAEISDAQNDSRALSLYRRAVEIDSTQARWWLRIAELSRRAGEPESALAACRKVIALERTNADAHFLLAVILDTDLKRSADAAAAYRDFVTKFPSDARTAGASQRIATLQPPPKRWTPQVTQAPRAGDRKKAEALFPEAYRLAQLQNLDAAALQYQKVIAADPSFEMAYYNLGAVYLEQRQFERAIVANETALAIRPNYLNARLNYAVALQRAGFLLDAAEQYKKVLEQNPKEETAHLGLGTIYADNPATRTQARWHYEKFVELAPNSPHAREVKRWLAGGGGR
jgi:tetratricopeptide (TPR) repeat protein